MIHELIALFDAEEFDKLEKLAHEIPIEELTNEISKLDKDLIVKIFPSLPEDVSAECFLQFNPTLQRYLVDNISGMQFKDISDEILETENVEEELKSEIFNDIMIQAEADVRHEKLLEIIDKIENKAFSSLKPILTEMRPIDVAELINDIDEDKVLIVFRLLPKYLANQTFVEMDSDTQEIVIKAFTDKELSGMINDLFVDDTVDLIEEMPSNVVRRILKVADKETREQINKLMGFPKDSAGSIMTPECITLRPWMTADEALAKMRKQAFDKETIYTCYVTDEEKKLLGIVTAKDILIHNPTDKIGDFMHDNVISAHTNTDKEEVSNLLAKYDLLAIPILDNEDRINGIVTIDDAIDVIQEEATEDISKINAVMPTSKPYLQASVFSIFKNRLPWLLILLISATFTGLIINVYEGTLNSLSPLLFACVPMLMGTGGNSGSQASVTIIQSLAMNEVSFKDTFKVLWKEVRVAILVALALAIACFGKLMLIDNLLLGYDYTIKISLVVSISLFATICIAKLIGCFLPLLAKKINLDPTVVANPFITTIVDIVSLLVFCMISIALL